MAMIYVKGFLGWRLAAQTTNAALLIQQGGVVLKRDAVGTPKLSVLDLVRILDSPLSVANTGAGLAPAVARVELTNFAALRAQFHVTP